jgi:radical SAM superfamily enzyme YgiQ (UPF0313 family)
MLKKVALANPRDIHVPKEHYAVYEHLGLGLIAAVLRDRDYDVKIFDACARDWPVDKTVDKILSYSPDFLGLTCTYRTYEDALEMGKRVKASNESLYVAFGGEHATFASDEILSKERSVDSVVRGEGEITIVEFIDHLRDRKDLENVKGVHFRVGDDILRNPDRPAIADLDTIPFAARDTLEYCLREGKTAALGLIATRGCRWKCHFCNANRFLRLGGGKAQRRRSPENVVDEIEMLYHEYFSKGLYGVMYFYDAEFVENTQASKAWARRFAEEMISRKIRIPFEVYGRVDSFSEKDAELIELLKRAGLVDVFLGLESGSQETLDALNKKATVKQNADALRLLKKYGINGSTHGFIMFNPYISFQGLRDSAKLLRDTGQASFWNMSQKLQIFPGTQLVGNLRREGLLQLGYSHTGVYQYRFREPKLKLLAERLFEVNDQPVSIRENSLVRYITTTLNEIHSRAIKTNAFDRQSKQTLDELKSSVENEQEKICDLNHNFFTESVDLAENEWREERFGELKEAYLNSMALMLDSISSRFHEFLSFVDSNMGDA